MIRPPLRFRAICVGVGWFGSTCVYYGVVLAPLKLADSIYLEAALGALLEVRAETGERWDS